MKITLEEFADDLVSNSGWYSPQMPQSAGEAIKALIERGLVNPDIQVKITFARGSYQISDFSEGNSQLYYFDLFPIIQPHTKEEVLSEWRNITSHFMCNPRLELEDGMFVLELCS